MAPEDAAMGEIVNLRQVKKHREKLRAAALAAQNRARHGRTSAEKRVETLAEERQQSALDGARMDAPDPGGAQ